jgi:hypothetical protein
MLPPAKRAEAQEFIADLGEPVLSPKDTLFLSSLGCIVWEEMGLLNLTEVIGCEQLGLICRLAWEKKLLAVPAAVEGVPLPSLRPAR